MRIAKILLTLSNHARWSGPLLSVVRILSNVLARNEDTDQIAGIKSLMNAFGISISFDDMRSCRHYSPGFSQGEGRWYNGVILALAYWISGRGSNPPGAEIFLWLSDVHLILSHFHCPEMVELISTGHLNTNIPNICTELFRSNWAFLLT